MGGFPFPKREDAYMELTKDVSYHKIPVEDRKPIVDKAWETGEKVARDLFAKYGKKKSVAEILIHSGLTVKRVAEDNVIGKMRYFSEYYSGSNQIVLYTKSIKQWARSNRIPYVTAEKLFLLHEYYHYMEHNEIGLTAHQYQVPRFKIGQWIIGRVGIRMLSEIAAYAFSRTYYELMDIN